MIPGSETLLADGVADRYKLQGIPCFGPTKAAARLETSKAYAKAFMHRHGIPTASFKTFTSSQDAVAYVQSLPSDARVVIKASGLAAGKGVLIPETRANAIDNIRSVMDQKQFGDAGAEVVIEEYMDGVECSVIALCDGYSYQMLPTAQDYKRLLDGDQGLNTGGMGAVASKSLITQDGLDQIRNSILAKVLTGMRREGHPFIGALYMGLMVTPEGTVKVVEFNVRFGDPETQAILNLVEPDSFVRCLIAAVDGRLDCEELQVHDGWAATVVAVSDGYPGSYAKGKPIAFGDQAAGISVYHAGTAEKDGIPVTSGGRVLATTTTAPSMDEALARAQTALSQITFDGKFSRKDIGINAVKLSQSKPATYASAGVSLATASEFVTALSGLIKSTERPGSGVLNLGSFAGKFDIAQAGFTTEGEDACQLVACTDGVGTKLMIANALGSYSTVGIDLVAMNVNDMIVHGAEPLFFLDYIACGKLSKEQSLDLVKGIVEGCKQARCALVGGETAELPGMYKTGEFDLAGFAVGAVSKRRWLPKAPRTDGAMVEGDKVFMLPSSGLHSNGFSLVRRVFPQDSWSQRCPWDSGMSLGQALLRPTRIYVQEVLQLLRSDFGHHIKAMAHITGGGLIENVPRVVPDGLCIELDASSWQPSPVFTHLQNVGSIASGTVHRANLCKSPNLTTPVLCR